MIEEKGFKKPDAIIPRGLFRVILDPKNTDADIAAFTRAALRYYDGEEPPQDLPPRAEVLFSFFVDRADEDIARWYQKCEDNARKGRISAERRGNRTEPRLTAVHDSQPDEPGPTDRTNTVASNNYNHKDTNSTAAIQRAESGESPTLEDVKAYAEAIGEEDASDYFFRVLKANEWKDTHGNPIRDWQSYFRSWAERERQAQNSRPQRLNASNNVSDWNNPSGLDAKMIEKIRARNAAGNEKKD